MVINCIYWERVYPQLITGKWLQNYVESNELRLLAISDVTCDFKGSIDLLRKFTTIENPFFVFHPEKNSLTDDYVTQKTGILYNSIENMPTQFPYDATNHFGGILIKYIPEILKADINKNLEKQ